MGVYLLIFKQQQGIEFSKETENPIHSAMDLFKNADDQNGVCHVIIDDLKFLRIFLNM